MQFAFEAGREAYFEGMEKNPSAVGFGTAMMYASTIVLGVLNDDAPYKEDVARMMSYEVSRIAAKTTGTLTVPPVEAVLASPYFQSAYTQAFAIPETNLIARYRMVGSMEEKASALESDLEQRLKALPTLEIDIQPLIDDLPKAFDIPAIIAQRAELLADLVYNDIQHAAKRTAEMDRGFSRREPGQPNI